MVKGVLSGHAPSWHDPSFPMPQVALAGREGLSAPLHPPLLSLKLIGQAGGRSVATRDTGGCFSMPGMVAEMLGTRRAAWKSPLGLTHCTPWDASQLLP